MMRLRRLYDMYWSSHSRTERCFSSLPNFIAATTVDRSGERVGGIKQRDREWAW